MVEYFQKGVGGLETLTVVWAGVWRDWDVALLMVNNNIGYAEPSQSASRSAWG